jgi:hypothetical protein
MIRILPLLEIIIRTASNHNQIYKRQQYHDITEVDEIFSHEL